MTRSKTSRARESDGLTTRPPLVLPARSAPKAAVVVPSFEELSLVSSDQLSKACHALHAHSSTRMAKKADTDLLAGPSDEALELVVTLKRMPSQRRGKVMPVRIDVPHPVVDPRERSVHLLVKDPQREYKDLLVSKNIKFISRVVGVTKLKGKFKPFEARRQLMAEADMFLADDRIVPMLPKLLGSKWLDSRKVPIPVSVKRTELKGELSRAIAGAYLHPSTGTCVSVIFGYLSSHSASDMLDNLKAVIPSVVARLDLDEIQALHIKSTTSTALPIWSCSLTDRFAAPSKPVADDRPKTQKIIALSAPDDSVPDPKWGESDDEADAAKKAETAAVKVPKKRKSGDNLPTASPKPTKKPRKDGPKLALRKA